MAYSGSESLPLVLLDSVVIPNGFISDFPIFIFAVISTFCIRSSKVVVQYFFLLALCSLVVVLLCSLDAFKAVSVVVLMSVRIQPRYLYGVWRDES